MIFKFELDLYLTIIDASFQKLMIGNQKCDNADGDDAEGDMIPMCLQFFSGDTITLVQINKSIF